MIETILLGMGVITFLYLFVRIFLVYNFLDQISEIKLEILHQLIINKGDLEITTRFRADLNLITEEADKLSFSKLLLRLKPLKFEYWFSDSAVKIIKYMKFYKYISECNL